MELRGTEDNPYHQSIGLVVPLEGKIAVIKRGNDLEKGKFCLPSETVRLRESIEHAILRGAREELGLTVAFVRLLGGRISTFKRHIGGTEMEKTTPYYLVEVKGDAENCPEPDEKENEILWVTPEEAIELFESQGNHQEADIVRRM